MLLISCACSTTVGGNGTEGHAVVSTATEDGCDRPGVRIDGVVNTQSGVAIDQKDSFSPIALQPGRYAISVACQNPLDKAAEECVFWGHPNEYPTYKMPLFAGIEYSFRCFVEGQELSYQISETKF